MTTECKICRKIFPNVISLSRHINTHSITKKYYYDKYIKTEEEGKCKTCGKETTFYNLSNGYHKFCSNKCIGKNKDVISKKKKTRKSLKHIKENNVTCLICGQKLINLKALSKHILNHSVSSKQYYDKYFKKEFDGICLECKSESKFISISKGYQTFCSLSCAGRNSLRNKKFRNTYLKNDLTKINKKREETNLTRYGDICANKNPIIKEKEQRTFLKNRIPKVLNQLKSYGIQILNIEEYKNNNSILKFKCTNCNSMFESTFFNLSQRLHKCNCTYEKSRSCGEKELESFIRKQLPENIEVVLNTKLGKYEIDIIIPNFKIAIEYNGLYWHSEQILKDAKNYHLEKLIECNNLGYRLIQIFEDEWIEKKNIVKSKIKSIFKVLDNKIHARKCIIKEIDSKTKNEFLNKFHLQNSDISKIKLGAFYNNDLVSVMTFSHGNISKGSKKIDNVWELNRFCTIPNTSIPGIASKLLTYFKRNYDWKEIFSYADRRWSDGDLYYKLGFNLDHITSPNYWYTKDGCKRIHRFNLRKKPDEPRDVSEWILRQSQGYYKVWDCGNKTFTMNNS